jgi:hypothetical protein
MPRSSSDNRRRLLHDILNFGHPASSPCLSCQSRGSVCLIMPENSVRKSVRCAECVRLGRKCIEASWEHEAAIRRQLEAELSSARVEVSESQRRASAAVERADRLWVALEELNRRARERAACLMEAIEEEERREAEISPSSGAELPLPLASATAVHKALDAGMFDPLSDPFVFGDLGDPFLGE